MGMNTDLPIYMLDITEDIEDDSQVDFIALVDRPAIQKNWNAFNKTQKFEIVNEDRRIISGAIMLADTPIFRSDATYGDYYVAFSRDTILKIVQKFFKKSHIEYHGAKRVTLYLVYTLLVILSRMKSIRSITNNYIFLIYKMSSYKKRLMKSVISMKVLGNYYWVRRWKIRILQLYWLICVRVNRIRKIVHNSSLRMIKGSLCYL